MIFEKVDRRFPFRCSGFSNRKKQVSLRSFVAKRIENDQKDSNSFASTNCS